MSNNPKVSVIIPVYNTEKYLRECLDSVVNQTLKDIEIICIDDGSTDNSLSILNEYAEHDDRFTIITQENQGAGAARNKGMEVAKGEYLYFLDSDDYICINAIKKLYYKAHKINADITLCLHNFLKKNKIVKNKGSLQIDIIKDFEYFSKEDIPDKILQIAVPNLCTKLFRTEFVVKNKLQFQELKICNDIFFDFITRILAQKITYVNKNLVTYRIKHKGCLTSDRGNYYYCLIDAFEKIKETLETKDLFDRYANSYYEKAINCFMYEYKFCNIEDKDSFATRFKKLLTPDYERELQLKIDKLDKISVIIPVYNNEKYIQRCIESIINQSYKKLEIICVNDGSTDNSLKILEEYAKNDDRIKIITQNRSGAAISRNTGILAATSNYISFVDSDDWVEIDTFEKAISKMTDKIDVVVWGANIINEGLDENNRGIIVGNSYHKIKVTGNKKITDDILKKTTYTVWNKLFKKSIIDKYNIKFLENRIFEDDNFTIIYFLHCKRGYFLPDYLYNYVQRPNSIMERVRACKCDRTVDNLYTFDSIYKHCKNCHLLKKHKKLLLTRFRINLACAYKFAPKNKKEEIKQIITKFANSYSTKILGEDIKNIKSKNYYKVRAFNEIIVSLTSYPARINTVHLAIESILNQSVKADNVILWLAEEQFPNKEKDLPQQLLNLIPQGLTIGWCENIKSYKKLIPTLRQYPDALIVTADDDNIYNKKWLEKLYKSYLKYPHDIHAHRVTKFKYKHGKFEVIAGGKEYYNGSSYLNKITGVGGVLYPPNCFYKDILNEDLIMKLAPTNDDQWFWLQAVLNGRKIRVVDKHDTKIDYIPNTQETALCKINDHGEKLFWRDFSRIMDYYPKLEKILINEYRFMKIKQLFNIQKIFSIKNKDTHKVLTVCGLKFKFKSKKLIERKRNKEIDKQFKKLNTRVKALTTKISEQQKSFRYELCKYMPENKYPEYLKDWYKRVTGETLNLDNPQTYNEKIQWLKLYNSTPLKTYLADKYLVREWVAEKIGEEYLIPLLGVWDNFDEINFDELPEKFVLKCNHGCGYNIIVNDKYTLDIEDCHKKINTWMAENFAYRVGLELHYANINRKILAEQYIENDSGDLYDYKFWCFDGKVKYIQFLSERNTNGLKMAFYDRNWNKQNFVYSYPLDTKTIEKPDNLDEMIKLAEKLAEGFNHVRIDFYRLNNGQIYFGEMTFTSCSGMCKWTPQDENLIMGSLIKLPTDEKVLTEV